MLQGKYERLATMAADLVQRRVAVIVALGDTAARSAKLATTTIPIVFTGGNDPVNMGLASSLNRPGGNVTGIANLNVELGPKRFELLHELLPAATIIAMLVNPASVNAANVSRNTEGAARALGITLQVLQASNEHEIDGTFAIAVQRGVKAMLIGGDGYFNSRSEQLAELTLRQMLPGIFQTREFVAAGGLMSYGDSSAETYREVGLYAGRILRGEKPADLPVQQSAKVELVINLKTAKALGLTVPPSLLARADEVIE